MRHVATCWAFTDFRLLDAFGHYQTFVPCNKQHGNGRLKIMGEFSNFLPSSILRIRCTFSSLNSFFSFLSRVFQLNLANSLKRQIVETTLLWLTF